jgi:predicted regulator of Ras-like GTPase activity (Roadblock/LC7/MglB family)
MATVAFRVYGPRSSLYREGMFKETLREIVENTDGSLAGVVMDSAGVAIDTFARENPGFDIDAIGIEYGVLLGSIRRATESLEAGTTQEVSIGTDKMVTIIRTLGESYYLALALRPDGNFGKGRYMMRCALPKLMVELA